MLDTTRPESGDRRAGSAWRRLAWFLGLYLAGLLVFGVTAYGLRALIFLGA